VRDPSNGCDGSYIVTVDALATKRAKSHHEYFGLLGPRLSQLLNRLKKNQVFRRDRNRVEAGDQIRGVLIDRHASRDLE